jgi:hypothetical protein
MPREGGLAGVHRLREAALAEGPGLGEHRRAVRRRDGAVPGRERERVSPQARGRAGRDMEGLERAGRQGSAGRQVEQHGRAQFECPPGGAGRAVLDVPVHPLAQQDRQPPIPAGQHRAKLTALVAPGAADEQDGQAGLKLVPAPRQQGVRVVAGDAEHGGDLADLKALAQLEFDDLALAGIEAGGGLLEQGPQLGSFGALVEVDGLIGHVGRHVQRERSLLRSRDSQALVARHGVQPGTEPLGVAQPVHPRRGDDERVLDGVRGVRRVAEQRPTVFEEGICVPVISRREPLGVAGHDGRDNLRVSHVITLAAHSRLRDERTGIVGIPTSLT